MYSVQIGAEFIWSVVGGTNFWQDYKNKYQTSFKDSNLGGELETTPAISVATALELTTKFHMKVRCLDSVDLSKSRNVHLEMFQESK